MATVGIVVVSYRADPEPLFRSVATSRHEVRWYIFSHGSNRSLNEKLAGLAAAVAARYYPYALNRGLTRSWNQGLAASFADGNAVTMVVNDDLFFYEDGFDSFADFVLGEMRQGSRFGLATLYGLETGTSRGVGSGQLYMTPAWQGGACFAVGAAALETIGYFDQNFWPAYYEDIDYFRRLRLAGVPIVIDQRTLLQHNRSFTLRTDLVLRRLHAERFARCHAYYVRKWGGPPGAETFSRPFGDENFSCLIPAERVEAPYGPGYDRDDLGWAASLGLLQGSLTEELILQLDRHAAGARRFLQWGAGDATAIIADFARRQGAELVLAIDAGGERLQRLALELPRYPFLHFRPMPIAEDGAADSAYCSYPLIVEPGFDVILIAGQRPVECARTARRALAPGGVVLLADWRAAAHTAAVRALFDTVDEGSELLVLRAPR